MKKLIAILFFAIFTASAFGQGIFKPVPDNLFKSHSPNYTAIQNASVWLPRFSAAVVANQFTYNKETKNLDMTSFSKVGLGISYSHFVPVNDLPYNNFSANAFVFFPTNDSGVSFALTVSALQYINVGAGYDVKLKTPFILTGIAYTF
jgi:hypothetical protein